MMIPDLWPSFRRRPRLDPSSFGVADRGAEAEALAAGLREHVRSDARFHASAAFNAWRRAAVPAAAAVVARPSLQSFLAHVGVELTLDRLLILADDDLAPAYYALLDRVDPAALERGLVAVVGDDAAGFGAVFDRFRAARHLLGYARAEAVAASLRRVLGLLRRPPPAPAPGALVPFVRAVEEVVRAGPWPAAAPTDWLAVEDGDAASSRATTRSP